MKCVAFSVLLLIVIIVIAAYAHHSDSDDPPVYDVRLPVNVLPTLYTMQLSASLVSKTFEGDMKISIVFHLETTQILFHAKDLTLSDIYLDLDGHGTIQPATAGYTGMYDLYVVRFDHVFESGMSGVLHIRFAGAILPTLAGFYLSEYKDASQKSHTIASTQFESTDARRAFPCFDEPSFKANFSITIITDKELDGNTQVVLSNMPLLTPAEPLKDEPTLVRWAFQPSVRMSTYLVAYCITDFTSKTATTNRGIPVSVWTAPDKMGGVDVALQAGVDAINEYEKFFEVLYPLPKLDQVAIPNFPVGAMENCQTKHEARHQHVR